MAKEYTSPWKDVICAKPLDEQKILVVRTANTKESALEKLAYAMNTERRNASADKNFDVFAYKVATGYEAVAASESVISIYDMICAETKCKPEENLSRNDIYKWVRQYLEGQKERKPESKDKGSKAK